MTEHFVITNFKLLQHEISLLNPDSKIIAVTKNQPKFYIEALLKAGHRKFAENRVNEAKQKWLPLKKIYNDIELHMIGHLQTNKVKEAVKIFDVIETVDSIKLAKILFYEMQLQNKFLICYAQINTGIEPQKTGIIPSKAKDFINICKNEIKLQISGLMCIPPVNIDPSSQFHLLKQIAHENNITILSMGMSDSYKIALKYGSSYVRIGSAIFSNKPKI